jgi:2-phospho-L-lactate guanylyltransferase
MNTWVIIPVKPLQDSKSRLADVLSADERAALTSQILESTLDMLAGVKEIDRVLVVSRDRKALKVARKRGASTYNETVKQGLNSALTRASHIAAAKMADCVLIIPADLPFITAEDIEMMIEQATEEVAIGNNSDGGSQHRAIVICSDHNRDGSNALLICPPTGFTFQYGPNSFKLHLEEASRLGMSARVVEASGIKFDIDTEEDWNAYLSMQMNLVSSS